MTSGRGLRAVAIPAEHGGWSLTLEPVLLGLLVAPSLAGGSLGVAALLAFLARTPAKLALVDRWRGRRRERTRQAERIAAVELAAIAGLIVVAVTTAAGPFWVPLVAAAPLLGVELAFDVRSRGRRLVPELAGTVGIGSVAAAIALAGGRDAPDAAVLWLVVAARAIASIPYVRVQLRRWKGQPARRVESDAAQVAAVAALGIGALAGLPVPPAAGIAVGILAAFQAWAVRIAPVRAALLGAQQVALGLGVMLAAGLGVLAP